MDPELIIYVTSDRNKKLDANAVELMKANEVLENVPAIKNQKIMTISYDELMDYGPAVIEIAVKGMLPKGPLGRAMFRKLKVYAGAEHQNAAQQPQVLDI